MDIREQIKEFFSEGGPLSRCFNGYEFRKSQLDMALAVYDSLSNNTHLLIEAPTGIGKSYAYLVPSIYYAIENKKKAIISTHTINLQEQLLNKDIPTLKSILPIEFKVSLLKGKNNYICPKRLKKAMENSDMLFETEEKHILNKLSNWAFQTNNGSSSDINFSVPFDIWSTVCAERGICTNRTCGKVEETDCFYQKAKYESSKADVLIINHHLFFTLFKGVKDANKKGYLSVNDFVIFDEAHTLETVASEHIVPAISREMIKFHLLRLYNSRKKKGFLLSFPSLHILPIVDNLLDLNGTFFADLRRRLFKNTSRQEKLTSRMYDENAAQNILKNEIDNLTESLRKIKTACKTELEENELQDYIYRFTEINLLIEDFLSLKRKSEGFVYWVELSSSKLDSNISLCSSPVDVSLYFRENIFRNGNTSVLTSATLTVNNEFNYFKKRLGAETVNKLQLPTQFDFYDQTKLFIPRDIPEPQKENNFEYKSKLLYWLKYFVDYTEGKALILFTNAKLLNEIGKQLKELYNGDMDIFMQGEGKSRMKLLNDFRLNINSVLLGLDSFWLGVDVPGEALSNLILTKLPFAVPDHPLIQARLEFIERNGGNSFMDYTLPEAVLKFRQGVGRLIRSKSDTGIIAILDKRILSKPYGKYFINSIDECPIEII